MSVDEAWEIGRAIASENWYIFTLLIPLLRFCVYFDD
jgi:hypothetical protein